MTHLHFNFSIFSEVRIGLMLLFTWHQLQYHYNTMIKSFESINKM